MYTTVQRCTQTSVQQLKSYYFQYYYYSTIAQHGHNNSKLDNNNKNNQKLAVRNFCMEINTILLFREV